jgi:hypothetical protein
MYAFLFFFGAILVQRSCWNVELAISAGSIHLPRFTVRFTLKFFIQYGVLCMFLVESADKSHSQQFKSQESRTPFHGDGNCIRTQLGSTAVGLRPTASTPQHERKESTAAPTGRASLAAALHPCRNASRHKLDCICACQQVTLYGWSQC